MPWWSYLLLFLASFLAGFVDSIAGGGGLITVPALLAAGLPPVAALGTNKLQASFGSGSASWHFAQVGLVSWKEARRGMAWSFAFAAMGAYVVQLLPKTFLQKLIPIVLLLLALYSLLQPRFGERERPARLSAPSFAVLFGILIGFYDGFLGPGTGTFWAVGGVVLAGWNLTKATAFTKAMNFASNLGALLLFLWAGQVWFGLGLLMGIGQWAGARLGSRMAIRKGARLIRPVFIAMVLILTLKLLLG